MTDLLIQQASRHSLYTQRFAGHLSNLFDPYITRLQREIKLILIDGPDETRSIRRINQLIAEWRSASLAIYGEYNDDILLAELNDFAVDESEWEVKSLSSVIKSPSIELVTPAPVQVWAAVNSSPLVFPDSQGVRLLDPFIRDWEANQIKKVSDIVRTGFITGRTSQQIAQDIAGKNGYLDNQNRASIKTMVRTATNHVSNLARQETNSQNSDIVIGYEIVATLDGRTSNFCTGADGTKVFNKGLIIWGATGRKEKTSYKPQPPFHPNCRTTTAPVLDARFAIDDSDATRASKGATGGKQVDANLTRYEWLKQQGQQGKKGREFVRDALGNERADLLIDGGLSAKEFSRLTLDEVFRPIPLKELRKKQSLQLAFDKIDD